MCVSDSKVTSSASVELMRYDYTSDFTSMGNFTFNSLDDFVASQAARFLDMVYLQQDAFDQIDSSTLLERQQALFDKVKMPA